MTTKLTLSIKNKHTIDKAKKYAKDQGRSLSALVENLLLAITSGQKINEEELMDQISPEIRSLVGIVKVPKNFDYKKALQDAIWEKHMK
jgi:hypothetical protein